MAERRLPLSPTLSADPTLFVARASAPRFVSALAAALLAAAPLAAQGTPPGGQQPPGPVGQPGGIPPLPLPGPGGGGSGCAGGNGAGGVVPLPVPVPTTPGGRVAAPAYGAPAPRTPGFAAPAAPPALPTLPGNLLTPRAQAATPGLMALPREAATGAGLGLDLDAWETWWDYNKDAFLLPRLRRGLEAMASGEARALTGLGGASGPSSTSPQAALRTRLVGEVVPALRRGVENGHPHLVPGALLALARLAPDPGEVLEEIEPGLAGQPQILEASALSLGLVDHARSLEILTALLQDRPVAREWTGRTNGVPERTRAFAAYGLGLLGETLGKPAVDEYVASVLWEEIRRDETPVVDVQVAAMIALAGLHPRDPAPWVEDLLAYLGDEEADVLVRAHAPRSLARLLEGRGEADLRERVVEALLDLSHDEDADPLLRQSAVQALGAAADPLRAHAGRVLESLQDSIARDRNAGVKHFAILALARLGGRAGAASERTRKEILPILLQGLRRGETTLRPWYALATGVMGAWSLDGGRGALPATAGEAVRERFRRERDPSARAACALALGLLRHGPAGEELRGAFGKSRDPRFRGYCAVALGLLGDRSAGDDLLAVLERDGAEPYLVLQSATALGLLGRREAVDALIRVLEPEDGGLPGIPEALAACEGLARFGDAKAVPALLRLLDNAVEVPLVRGAASEALRGIAERGRLPLHARISCDLNYAATVITMSDPMSGTGLLNLL